MEDSLSNVELGIALVEHPKFQWYCGMKTACGVRIKEGWHTNKWLPSFDKDDLPVPDIEGPATKGCLLDLIRKIGPDKTAYVCEFDEGWAVQTWPEPNCIQYYHSEGAALAEYIIQSSRFI